MLSMDAYSAAGMVESLSQQASLHGAAGVGLPPPLGPSLLSGLPAAGAPLSQLCANAQQDYCRDPKERAIAQAANAYFAQRGLGSLTQQQQLDALSLAAVGNVSPPMSHGGLSPPQHLGLSLPPPHVGPPSLGIPAAGRPTSAAGLPASRQQSVNALCSATLKPQQGAGRPHKLSSSAVRNPVTAEWQETDGHRIAQRQKQICFGKVTVGYRNYVAAVAEADRQTGNENHPVTPREKQVCSKRSWDCQVGVWRRALHMWDSNPSAEQMQLSDEELKQRQIQAQMNKDQPFPERHHFRMPPPRDAADVGVAAPPPPGGMIGYQPDNTAPAAARAAAPAQAEPPQGDAAPPLKIKCVVGGDVAGNHCKMIVTPQLMPYLPFRQLVEEKVGKVLKMYYSDAEGDTVEIDDDTSIRSFLETIAGGVKPLPKLVAETEASQAAPPPQTQQQPGWENLLREAGRLNLSSDAIHALGTLFAQAPPSAVTQVCQVLARTDAAPPAPESYATPRKVPSVPASAASTPAPDLVELSPSPCKDGVQGLVERLAELTGGTLGTPPLHPLPAGVLSPGKPLFAAPAPAPAAEDAGPPAPPRAPPPRKAKPAGEKPERQLALDEIDECDDGEEEAGGGAPGDGGVAAGQDDDDIIALSSRTTSPSDPNCSTCGEAGAAPAAGAAAPLPAAAAPASWRRGPAGDGPPARAALQAAG